MRLCAGPVRNRMVLLHNAIVDAVKVCYAGPKLMKEFERERDAIFVRRLPMTEAALNSVGGGKEALTWQPGMV